MIDHEMLASSDALPYFSSKTDCPMPLSSSYDALSFKSEMNNRSMHSASSSNALVNDDASSGDTNVPLDLAIFLVSW